MKVARLRWRLARLVAPHPIMRDPAPGEEGVFVIYRSATNGSSVEWTIRAERFRLKSSYRLPSLDYGADDFRYRPSKGFTRFVGTVGS